MRASACAMRASMTGADRTWPSSTIASWRPTFCSVTRVNFVTPSLFSVKPTAGWLNSSMAGLGVAQIRCR